jgi:predicted phage terminase large subunit-like protein
VGQGADSKIWLLDAWADRIGTTGIVKAFIDMCEKWQPIVAAYEDMAQQSLLADPIMAEAENRGIIVPLTPVTVSTKVDKNWRIRTLLQPVIGAGRLMINEGLTDVVNEITNFPMAAVRDLVDALASAVGLVPPPAAQVQNRDAVQDMASYLRQSGATPSHIEAAVREAGGYQEDDHVPQWQTKMLKQGRRLVRR